MPVQRTTQQTHIKPERRSLGPVPDLERHLPAEWWRTLFQAMYLKTDGDVVENDLNTIQEVDWLIRQCGVDPNDKILDLCCGQGRHVIEFARRGFRQLTGLDQSRYLIRLARKRAREAQLNIAFHEGDARKARFKRDSFHTVIVMGNSFGYFDCRSQDLVVLSNVRRMLKSHGNLVLDISDGQHLRTQYQPRSWEWLDEEHLVCRERSLSAQGDRLISREVIIHTEQGALVDQFYAERLYSAAEIVALLEEAGFEEVRTFDGLTTNSTRNQDLGMLSHRLLATAKAPRKAVQPVARTQKVTVLLGDPTLADGVNPDMNSAEELESRARMMEALAELPEYRFEFLNNHATMLSDLRNFAGDFVLNFCDEGFGNDARLELHVPATLEMMKIPYTGAAPACLAMCYDKFVVRSIASSLDIPVPEESLFEAGEVSASLPGNFPALVKPARGDGSYGITQQAVVTSPEAMLQYVRRLRQSMPGEAILVQEFLPGAEFSVGLVGNPGLGLRALPILEVDYSELDGGLPQLLCFESKWVPDSPYWSQIKYKPAELDQDASNLLVDYARRLFERLGCRDYARIDFRADAAGTIKLLEFNPNPGWVWDGKLNMMAGFEGLRYADLLGAIIDAARLRIRDQVFKSGVISGNLLPVNDAQTCGA